MKTKRNQAPEPETITPAAGAQELFERGRRIIAGELVQSRIDPVGAPAPEPAPAEVPEWVNDTPRDIDYDLQMYEDHEGEMEHIALTRGEYIQIKAHLAAMRGYAQKAA